MTMTTTTASPLLSIAEGQAYLGGVSRSQLYELKKSDRIRFVKIGRRAFVTRTSLDEYVAQISA
ncbi:MAG: helix-turn-helix domain-containing protein [Microcella sp.]|uniref:helix-turn-helix domain-containing protein n=1 Tax=Microcella sp. TaxID=1913979 RepID=UPI0033153DB9